MVRKLIKTIKYMIQRLIFVVFCHMFREVECIAKSSGAIFIAKNRDFVKYFTFWKSTDKILSNEHHRRLVGQKLAIMNGNEFSYKT